MSNSTLVDVTKLSPNHSGVRTHSIDRITPHCFVGQVSVEAGLDVFQPKDRNASCNYLIGSDGRVGLCVNEDCRSWCSSSRDNDQRAVTIECASDSVAPYAFNDFVYNKLIELCTDICHRNNKSKLLWISDKTKALNYNPKPDEMLLTVHRWFDNRSCPGDWLYSRMGALAYDVTYNLRLCSDDVLYRVQVGAFKIYKYALNFRDKIIAEGFEAFIVEKEGYYKVQVGAFYQKENAVNLRDELKSRGYDCFINI